MAAEYGKLNTLPNALDFVCTTYSVTKSKGEKVNCTNVYAE